MVCNHKTSRRKMANTLFKRKFYAQIDDIKYDKIVYPCATSPLILKISAHTIQATNIWCPNP